MGSDRLMMLALLYIVITIMAFCVPASITVSNLRISREQAESNGHSVPPGCHEGRAGSAYYGDVTFW